MYVKYGIVLRGISRLVPKLYERYMELTHGNKYTTTLHLLKRYAPLRRPYSFTVLLSCHTVLLS